jgi:site-specific recombinase
MTKSQQALKIQREAQRRRALAPEYDPVRRDFELGLADVMEREAQAQGAIQKMVTHQLAAAHKRAMELMEESASARDPDIAIIEIMNKMLESDDVVATLHAEVKRLSDDNASLQSRVNALMREKNKAVDLLKSAQRKLDRLYKQGLQTT